MSHITTRRKMFTLIDQCRFTNEPHTFEEWKDVINHAFTVGVTRKWLNAWIIYHTQPGQTRRDLFAALNASPFQRPSTPLDKRPIVANITTTSGRNEA